MARRRHPNHRLHLNITGVCNLNCTHCYQDDHTGKPMPIERIEAIFVRYKAFRNEQGAKGRAVVSIAGGEPTTRRDLEDVIRLARRHGLSARLTTNATMIDLERAKALRKAGLRMVQVSLDGATPATHEAVRGSGNWKKTMAGIEAMRKAGMFVVLSMVLLPDLNLEESPQLLDLSRQLRVIGVKFQRLVERGHARRNLATEGQFHQTMIRILEHAAEIRYKRLLMFFEPLANNLWHQVPELCRKVLFLTTDMCHCDRTELMEIDYNGDVYYCRVGEALGNVFDEDLGAIWEHDLLRQIRAKSAKGACQGCSAWAGCHGGCPAATYGLERDVTAPDRACPAWSSEPGFIALPMA